MRKFQILLAVLSLIASVMVSPIVAMFVWFGVRSLSISLFGANAIPWMALNIVYFTALVFCFWFFLSLSIYFFSQRVRGWIHWTKSWLEQTVDAAAEKHYNKKEVNAESHVVESAASEETAETATPS